MIAAGLVLLMLLAAVRIWDPPWVETLRLASFDFLQRQAPRAEPPVRVLRVDVDDESLARLGQWPWPRVVMARLLERIGEAGPGVIGLDLLLSEPDRLSPIGLVPWVRYLDIGTRELLQRVPDHDELLAQTMARYPVVIGQVVGNHSSAGAPAGFNVIGADASSLRAVPAVDGVVRNLRVFEIAASGVGSTSYIPERDGVVRRVQTVFRVGDDLVPSFGVEMLRVLTGGDVLLMQSGDGIERLGVGGLPVDTGSDGSSWMHYASLDRSSYVPAWKILEGEFDPARFSGRMVIVGASASALQDLKMSPLDSLVPGMEVWAQWLETVVFGRALQRPEHSISGELLVLAMMVLVLLRYVPRLRAAAGVLLVAILLIGLLALCVYLYLARGVLFDFTYPLGALVVTYSVLAVGNYRRADAQRTHIQHAFSHYLAPSIVKQLAEHPEQLAIGGESREITSLFTDLAGFTRTVEALKPAQVVAILNAYLDGLCRIALEHEGTIDKIVGDAVHVFFNAPLSQPDHADRAVRCAVAMSRFGDEFSRRQREAGLDVGTTRVGVNTGIAVVGNFGGEARFDYTAYGDVVNTASRLEGANKSLGTGICIGETTVAATTGLRFRPIGRLHVVGRDREIMTYEPWLSDADAELADYLEAYRAMRECRPEARVLFGKLAGRFPDDGLVRLHAGRLSVSSDDPPGDLVVLDRK